MTDLMREGSPACVSPHPARPGQWPRALAGPAGGGRLSRWGLGGRVRVAAVAAVLAVTAGAMAAVGPAGPAAASSGTSFLQAWGRGAEGQLGNGSTADQHSAADLTSLTKVAQVSSGYLHT
ncbi:MAG: hypothetical protein JWN52_49, partial [Actinomycetia bacterium]|nr:hypothetical protein [Actinomycetes bacterium]